MNEQMVIKGATRAGFRPLYQQVKESLVERVRRGEWRPGTVLPSEQKLAAEYAVSLGTIRKAIEDMAAEKLLVRRQGRGTFVSTHGGLYQPFQFHCLFLADGGVPVTRIDYLSCLTTECSPQEAEKLGIIPGARVVRVERVRVENDRPLIAETIVIREDLCPEATAVLDDVRPSSIYACMENHFGVLVVKVDERVRASCADHRDVERLQLEDGAPVLEIERLAHAVSGDVVEFRVMRARGDMLYFRAQNTER